MPSIPFGQTYWAIAVLLLAVIVGLVAIVVTWTFEQRRARLPDSTRHDDLKERIAAAEVLLDQREARLRELDGRIHNRDRMAAEVAALSERLENLRAEMAALAGAEQQIDAMKQRAAEAAAAYATERAKLDEAQAGLTDAETRTRAAQDRLDLLSRQADALDADLQRRRDTLPGEIAALIADVTRLEGGKTAMLDEIAQLKGVRESLHAARDEHAATMAKVAELQARYGELAGTLPAKMKHLVDELARLEGERDALVRKNVDHQATHDRLAADLAEIDSLEARRASLEEVVAQLRSKAGADQSGTRPDDGDLAEVTRDLKELPSCLKVPAAAPRAPQLEQEALHEVSEHLKRIGLTYDRRTLLAFHTALKINDAAQMTVLAGVSGTGKSLLPRRYAEAMGLRFLQIAVEPRWDSPQDLLGFYNYIEKRYRATDLARALVHMDTRDSSTLSDSNHKDEVMLVLLDEMNLARVEYYFSEFLSRLEVRPHWNGSRDLDPPSGAFLPIDIPGRKAPIQLFPSHNVLFAGTMNDDETTQALSDKVLDRSNVMQFAAPDAFKPHGPALEVDPTNRFRSFSEWRKWIQTPDRLHAGEQGKAEQVIKSLAEIMNDCGRPFGHRLNDAVLAYAVNYPRDKGTPLDVPLADQIELRILPKLRGLAIEGHQQHFDKLSALIRDDLGDRSLANYLDGLIVRQRDGTGQFNWRGFNRGPA